MEGGGRMRERRKEGEREERSLLLHLFFLVFEEQGENEGRGEESKNEGGGVWESCIYMYHSICTVNLNNYYLP